MKRLTKSAFERAAAFIQSTGRPLEQSRFAYHFRGGSAADVLTALSAFQNADGGFGHGLEPDVRLGDSSVIATTLGFQRFGEVAAPVDDPAVVKACRYLLDTYNAEKINWPIIPPNVDDAPHAPWWTTGGDLEKSLANPRAEITGYVNQYAVHFPAAMRQQVTESVIGHLHEQPDSMEMHDLLCYIRLSETESLPADSRASILEKLKRIVEKAVERNPEGWKSYGLQPLAVVSSPTSPFAAAFRQEIEHNLDFIIDAQSETGGWMPNWTWGGGWPDAWAQAQRDWSGHITLENLRLLHAFGRIDV